MIYRGVLYTCRNNGVLTAYDLASGEQLFLLARGELGAPALATPAIADGMIVFRTVRELIGVGFTGS